MCVCVCEQSPSLVKQQPFYGTEAWVLIINHAWGREQPADKLPPAVLLWHQQLKLMLALATVTSAANASLHNDSSSLPVNQRHFQENPLTHVCVFSAVVASVETQRKLEENCQSKLQIHSGPEKNTFSLLQKQMIMSLFYHRTVKHQQTLFWQVLESS